MASKPRRQSSFSERYSDNMHLSAKQISAEVLSALGFAPETISRVLENVEITGASEPFLPCVFRLTDVMTSMHVSIASLANLYAEQRQSSGLQQVKVDTETATMQFFACMAWEIYARDRGLFPPDKVSGPADKPMFWREATPALVQMFAPPDMATRFSQVYWQLYETGDKRYTFLSPYINPYPPEKLLPLLGFKNEEVPHFFSLLNSDAGVPEALEMMATAAHRIPSTIQLEKDLFKEKAGGCWSLKTLDEFLDSDQGDWCRSHDQIHIDKVEGWAPAGFGEPLQPGDGPYKGLKVIEMSRIVMGPVISSFLAGMGADIIRVASASVNEMPNWNYTQTTNKRCVSLDLKDPQDKAVMDKLLEDADIIVQNNAYGAVERLGYGFEALCERFKGRKKGFIYAEGNTLGFTGPWASSGGFEHVGQICSGAAVAMGREVHGDSRDGKPNGVKPWFFPGTMCDATTGVSGATGLHAAIHRRAVEGGSYRVRVALARTGMFYQEVGMYESKELRKKVMNMHDYLDPSPSLKTRYMGVMDAFYNYHESMREKLPHLFTDKHWMTFTDSRFVGNVPLRIPRPAYSLSLTPPKIRIQPRPLGFDSTKESKIFVPGPLKWVSGLEDVKPVEEKEFYFKTVEGGREEQGHEARL